MALNPNIILAGQQPDYLGIMGRSDQMAQSQIDNTQKNRLAQMYQENGPGILAGDTQSLNRLAQFDPNAALNVQGARQGMAMNDEKMQMARAQAKQQAQQHVASLDANQRKAEAEKIDRALAMGTQAKTPEEWDALMTQFGAQDYVGQFEKRDLIFAGALGFKDALEMSKPPVPAFGVVDGQFYDKNDPGAGAKPIPGMTTKDQGPEPLSNAGKEALDRTNGFIPDTAPPVDPDRVDQFRKEFSGLPAVKSFSEQVQAYGRVEASAKDPSAAGDLAMIFNYMKLLDPGSVVREGEFATAQNAAGVDDRIVNTYNRVLSGERLAPAQRDDFVSSAEKIYVSAEDNYKRLEEQFKSIAAARGYPIDQSLINFARPPANPVPTAGTGSPPGSGSPPGAVQLSPEAQSVFEKYRSQPQP